MDFASLIESHSRALSEKLEAARSALKHTGQKGTAVENALIELLNSWLPHRLGVSEGVIVSSSGYVSSQQDIIIYDRSASPVFFEAGNTRAIPIEFVFATIEVKSCLQAQDILEISEKNAILRSQQKFFIGDTEPKSTRQGGYTYHQAGEKWYAPPLNSFVFAYETRSVDSCWEVYKKIHSDESDFSRWIDGVCVNREWFMTRRSAEFGIGDTVGRPNNIVCVTETPFLAFAAQLWLHSTQWCMREVPAMYRYLNKYTFNFDRAEKISARVVHTDVIR